LARLAPATTATAASASTDRLNFDFIALLPFCSRAAAAVIYFERFERRIFVCMMIRRESVSTITTAEKRASLGAIGLDQN
jgi:GTP-dependent phosphoenolpyruvate carboxykinase